MPTSRGWAFRSSATATGTTSLSISKPTGTLDDDLMIMCLVHKGAGYASVPGGWTLVEQNIAGSTRGEVYWKRASSEGSSYSITGLADTAQGAILSYEGGLLSGDPVVFAESQTTSGTSLDFTTIEDDCLILFVNAIGDDVALSNSLATVNEEARDGHISGQTIIGSSSTTGSDNRLTVTHSVQIKAGGDYQWSNFGSLSVERVLICVGFKMEPVDRTSVSRFYHGNHIPVNITKGPLNGVWTSSYGHGPVTYGIENYDVLLSPTKHDVGSVIRNQVTTNVEGGVDVIWKRFWTPPLEAQTLSGTLQINLSVSRFLEGGGTGSAYFKVHAYITVGQTTEIRTLLIDNQVTGSNFSNSTITGVGFTSPISLSGDVEEGDSVVIELGANIPDYVAVNPPTYPPTEWIRTDFWSGTGASSQTQTIGTIDLEVGESATAKSPWFEFSNPLILTAPSSAPINDDIADAIEISSFPFVDTQDTSNAQSVLRSVWYKWTADADRTMIVHLLGTRYLAEVRVLTGSPLETPTSIEVIAAHSNVTGSRAFYKWEAVNGTDYYFQVKTDDNVGTPNCSGGSMTFELCELLPPEADDLYYPCSNMLTVWRGSQLINITNLGNTVSGIAIDYTGRTIDNLNGGTHSDHRVLVGFFSAEIFSLLDIATLNSGEAEIDFSDNFASTINLSALEVNQAGLAYAGFFGNGFRLVAGSNSSFQNTLATGTSANLGILDAIQTENQTGAPFTPTYQALALDVAGLDYISLNTDETELWYTSGGQYVSVGGTKVKRWDLVGNTQLPDFATLPTGGGPNPSPKGIKCLPDGGALVCNGNEVVRLDNTGTITLTYTPSPVERANTLADVDLIADGTAFWVMDSDTSSFYKFDLDSGAQVESFWTHLGSGNSTSFVVYRADVPPLEPEEPTEPEEPEGCPVDTISSIASGTVCSVDDISAIE